MPGVSVPHIELGSEIGRGAFARVHRGRHRTLDVEVAVKLIDSDRVRDHDVALREARLMARLDHPNLLRIFDAGHLTTALYLVLELMDGTCAEVWRVSGERAVELARQLLAGVQALHDARVLHRDIKPANCLVRARDGRVKLADLGIAVEQSMQTGRPHDLAGTLPFMAPELFGSPPRFSPASDLYALGRTLQCLVLDRSPFPRGSTAAVLAWIQRCEPPAIARERPDLPPALSSLIDRLCAFDPARRPSAAKALADLATVPAIGRTGDTGTTVAVVGSWVVGIDMPGDANFEIHAATHLHTGAAARIAHLKLRCPLSRSSPLILASAERASTLEHPGIAAVVDWGLHDGRAWVVTRAQGRDIETLIQTGGPVPEVEALQIVRDLADALAYLHNAGLVYQVVNPLFAVVTPDARAVQLAWPMFCVESGSAARSGDAAQLISVPRYASLESFVRPSRTTDPPVETGQPPADPGTIGPYTVTGRMDVHDVEARVRITERADLHGLGELLYYLIAGRSICPPNLAPNALAYRKSTPARLREAVPSVLASTDRLVAELTAPDPAHRPGSALAVRDRVDRILATLRPDGPDG